MKILIVNKFLYANGGSETYIFELQKKLEKEGHQVQFFGMEDERNIVSNAVDQNVSNINFHEISKLKQVTSSLKIVYSKEARKKLRLVIEDFKPNIVHLNNYNFQITPSVLYEIKKFKIPIVMTLHDFQLVCPNHMMYIEESGLVCEKCKGRNYKACIKNKCIHNSIIRSALGTFEAWIYHKLATYDKKIDYYIAPSQFLADKVIEFGEKQERVITLHNFITELDVTKHFDKNDYVLYFGRLSKQKGIFTFIDVIKRNPDITFKIAGGGELVEEISALANVEFMGFVKGDELVKLIGEASFSIYPSEWYENCPMSVLESQMYGTPVIGARIGGIPELIDDDTDGLLFESGNAIEFSACVRKLYDNKNLLKEFSINCRNKVQKFSIDKYYKELMDIYQMAMDR